MATATSSKWANQPTNQPKQQFNMFGGSTCGRKPALLAASIYWLFGLISAVTTVAPASDGSSRCNFTIPLDSGENVTLSVASNGTVSMLTTTIEGTLRWFSVGFSETGLMSAPSPTPAVFLHEYGGSLEVAPYLLTSNEIAGVDRMVGNVSQIFGGGMDILDWDIAIDAFANTSSFSFSVLTSSIVNQSHLIAAVSATPSFIIANHGPLGRGSLGIAEDWLHSCEPEPESDYCDIPNEHYVCEACGRCSFKLRLADTNFSAYPTMTGLDLPNFRLANHDYKMSWLVYPPVPGSNLTADGEEPYIHLLLQAVTDGWLGLGFVDASGNFGMEGTDVYWGGINDDGDLVFKDAYTFTIGPVPSDETWGGNDDIWDVAGSRDDGILSVEFKRKLVTNDFTDVTLDSNPKFPCIWAYSSDGVKSMDMTRYHRYSRGFLTEHFFSINCNPGEYLVNDQCTPCDKGHYCPDQTTMVECPAGFYADEEGMVACISCDNSPNVGFANVSRSQSCSDCPPNTERTIESSVWGGSRAEECICKVGYYHPTRHRGLECLECPEGGFCAGGVHLPMAKPGYWGMIDYTGSFTACGGQDNGPCSLTTNITVDQWFSTMDLNHDEVLELSELSLLPAVAPQLAILSASWDLDSNNSNISYRQFLGLVQVNRKLPASFVPYNSATRESLCKEGYTGELCSVCEEGYFRFDVSCMQCPSDPGAATLAMIAGVGVVIGLWLVAAKLAIWLESDTFDLLLLFMQCMSIIMSFDLQYHEWINPLAPVFSLAAFNMDILNPTCIMPWTYSDSSLLQLLLPLVLLLLAVARVAVSRCLFNRGYAGKHICGRCLPAVPSDLDKVVNQNIASVSSFFFIVYAELVLKSIAPFQLLRLPDGRMVMKAAPFIEAWTSHHWWLQVAPGVLGAVAYVAVIPTLYAFHLSQLKKDHRLANHDTLERFHWLYGKYHLKAYYWETVVLARRCILCVVLIVLHEWPMTQGMIALGFLVGLLCAHFYTQPYRRDATNFIDTLFIAILIATNFGGLMFQAGIEFPDLVAAILLIGLSACVAVALYRAGKEVSSTLTRRQGEKLVRLPDTVMEHYAKALFSAFESLNAEKINSIIVELEAERLQADMASAQEFESVSSPERRTSRWASVTKVADRRSSSVHAFPLVSEAAKFQGAPHERPLMMQDIQAVLARVAKNAWDELRAKTSTSKVVANALLRYESTLRRSATVHSDDYWESTPPSSPTRAGGDSAKVRKLNSQRDSADCGAADRLLTCILGATQSRVSLQWASEVFDHQRRHRTKMLKLASIKLKRLASIRGEKGVAAKPSKESQNVYAARRREKVTTAFALKFIKSLREPQIRKDLRTCLQVHPWRAYAFSNFLTVNCVEGEVNVAAMEKFYRLQDWLAAYMSDTSDTSVFNDTPNAEFYRKLVVTQPHILDWVLQANPDQVTQFREVLTELELFTEHWHEVKEGRPGLEAFRQNSEASKRVNRAIRKGKPPPAAEQVIFRDHQPSILHWLIFDNHEGRMQDLRSLVAMLQQSGGYAPIAMKSRMSMRHQESMAQINRLLRGGRNVAAILRWKKGKSINQVTPLSLASPTPKSRKEESPPLSPSNGGGQHRMKVENCEEEHSIQSDKK